MSGDPATGEPAGHGTPQQRLPGAGIRRALVLTAVVAIGLSAATVVFVKDSAFGPVTVPQAGAQPAPTGPGGGSGSGGSGGPAFPMQPPDMPSPPGGCNSGSYPAPDQGNGISIYNSGAPQGAGPQGGYQQAPNYPQQLQPANGTQPPNYDAPLQTAQPQPQHAPPATQQAPPRPEPSEPASQPPPASQQPAPRDSVPTQNVTATQPAPTQERDSSRQTIRKTSCDLNNPGDCRPEDAPNKMKQCENDPAVPDTALIIVFYGMGGVTLTCGDYFHIIREHFQQAITDEDRTNFLQCVSKTLFSGQEWAGAIQPNIGRKFQNSTTGVWGYVSVRPGNTIATAYTSGDGKDWGGCAAHGFF